jgi:hypothetical protein
LGKAKAVPGVEENEYFQVGGVQFLGNKNRPAGAAPKNGNFCEY